jgi:hypothetical protein
MPEQNRIFSFLRSFSAGVDSNKAPLDLPANQLAYLSNGSLRGDFVKQRPNFYDLTLVDNTGGLFQQGLYQGAAYYRGSDGSIICSVGGNLFQITIANYVATVNRINSDSIKQSSSATKSWMWQAENFLIWTDGINFPVYWDGGSSIRRSVGVNLTAIATTTASFTVPQVGAQISVPVSNNIPAASLAPNTACLIGSSQFIFNSIAQQTTSNSTSLTCNILQSAPSGADYLLCSSAQQAVIYENNVYAGYITVGGVVQGSTTITDWSNIKSYAAQQLSLTFTGAGIPASAVSNGAICTINGNACVVNSFTSISISGTSYILSLKCTPQSNTPWAVTGAFTIGSYTVSSSGGSIFWSSSQSTSAPQVTFKVTLNQAPWGITGSQAFTVYDLNGFAIQFTGTVTSGSSVLTNCFMGSPPTFSSPVQTISSASSITSLKQLVQGNWTSQLTSVGNVYNVSSGGVYSNVTVGANGTISIPAQLGVSVPLGTVIQAATGLGNIAIFIVTVAGGVAGSTQLYATFTNQTAVQGSTLAAGAGIIAVPEMPVCGMGTYGMGRNWIAIPDGTGKFTEFIACDIVGGVSGTSNYNFKDAVLKTSQNAFLAGGGTFSIPNSGESITAMQFVASLDASLGQGFLQIFTDETVFSCNAPADITTWASLTTPILTESMIGNGAASQDSVVQVNNDLLFRLRDGGIQSLTLARLDYNKWGNTPISTEVSSSIGNDDLSLLKYNAAEVFNNRFICLCKPSQQTRGVVHASAVALNFDPISSLRGKEPAIWEGEWTGINALGMVNGIFGSTRRCFALTLNNGQIGVREILNDVSATQDNGSTNVTWEFHSPMIFEREDQKRQYKRLIDGEVYLDQITAPVSYTVWYKADQNNAWTQWYSSTITPVASDTGYRPRLGLGSPKPQGFDKANNTPLREGYDFQVKIQFTGACRFLGARFAADIVPQPEFSKPI